MDSCPEKANALMGESRDARPAERTQLTGKRIIGFSMNSPGLKNKSLVILYCFNKKNLLPYLPVGTTVPTVVLVYMVFEQAYFTVNTAFDSL